MDRSVEECRVTSEGVIGFCFECHHELVVSGTDVCPECGRWFDPEDSATSYRRKPGFFWSRALPASSRIEEEMPSSPSWSTFGTRGV